MLLVSVSQCMWVYSLDGCMFVCLPVTEDWLLGSITKLPWRNWCADAYYQHDQKGLLTAMLCCCSIYQFVHFVIKKRLNAALRTSIRCYGTFCFTVMHLLCVPCAGLDQSEHQFVCLSVCPSVCQCGYYTLLSSLYLSHSLSRRGDGYRPNPLQELPEASWIRVE